LNKIIQIVDCNDIRAIPGYGLIGKIDEPFIKLFNQGMLHAKDGNKMSKSLGNVINPIEMINKYGSDCLRLGMMSFASPDSDTKWDEKVLEGSFKFLNKVVDYFEKVRVGKSSEKIESKLNKTIKEVTSQIENFRYNLAIIKVRELFDSLVEEESKEVLEKCLKLLHVFCPHITEELWEKIGNKRFISLAEWPKVGKINEGFLKQGDFIDKVVGENWILKVKK